MCYGRAELGIFKGVKKVEPLLDFTWRRHKVIISNIANADTPNYRAVDLEFRREVNMLPLKTTNSKHINILKKDSIKTVFVKNRVVGNDNNNVSIEGEMAKLAQNRIAYEVYMKMALGGIDKLNNIIRGGRR